MSDESSLAQYGAVDMAAAEQFNEKAKAARGSGGYFKKFPEGKTVVRIMPPRIGQKVPWVVVSEHYLKLPTGDVSFVCPVAAGTGPCPACTREKQLLSTGLDADTKQSKSFAAKLRYYCNAIDRSCENEGPKIMPFGVMIYKKLYTLLTDPDVGFGDFTNVNSGCDLIIVRTGSGETDTKYDVIAHKSGATPLCRDNATALSWLSMMSDLTNKQRTMSYDDIVDTIKNGRRPER